MCRMSDSTVTSVGGVNKDKLCLVCGDKALGYNFNAISCESCKAFFRRNAHKELVASAIDQLLPDQQSLVRELQFAMEETSFLAQTSTSMKSLPSTPTEFVNMAEGFVRKVIKVAKHIATFKTLPKDDQIALLKGSVVDIMMLRSAVNYDPYTESWNLSTKDCLNRSTSSSSSEVADRSELEGHERVQKVQEDYATALQAYAGLRFPEDRTLFARLVMKLTDLRNINEVHSKMLLKLKIDDMEPLLLEVFDLPS
nr:hypothetical protein BaRGS_034951 [Batillaria attramentaria]